MRAAPDTPAGWIRAAERMRGVFNHHGIIRFRHVANGRHIARKPGIVNWNDCPHAPSHASKSSAASRKIGRVHIDGCRVDIDELRGCADITCTIRAGYERHRAGENVVVGTNTGGSTGEMQCGSAAAYREGVAGTHVVRDRPLEFFYRFPLRQRALAHLIRYSLDVLLIQKMTAVGN